jgi:serine/threonine protein kinase
MWGQAHHKHARTQHILVAARTPMDQEVMVDTQLCASHSACPSCPGLLNPSLWHYADCSSIHSLSVQEDVLASDKALDVWACGAVLFAMLTAQPPTHSSGTQERTSGAAPEAADDEVAGKLVWPDNIQISDSCKNLLEVMLSVNSADRPTIHQVLDHPWWAPSALPTYVQF